MIQKQVQVGRDTYTVSGDNLQQVLKEASELETIARRVSRDATIQHRHSEGYDFYEAIRFVKGNNGTRMAKKQLGNSEGDLFLSANEPWRIYDKDSDSEFVQFDFLTDDAKEWGFDESAVNGWVKAKVGKSGKLRTYKPIK